MFPSSFHLSSPSIDQFQHNPIREDKNNQIRTTLFKYTAIDDMSAEILASVCQWRAPAET
jgi:hypothetical protein